MSSSDTRLVSLPAVLGAFAMCVRSARVAAMRRAAARRAAALSQAKRSPA